MRKINVIILLAVVTQAHAEELAVDRKSNGQDFMDNFVSQLVDQIFNKLVDRRPLHSANLDNATFTKIHPCKSLGTFSISRATFPVSLSFRAPGSLSPAFCFLPISHPEQQKGWRVETLWQATARKASMIRSSDSGEPSQHSELVQELADLERLVAELKAEGTKAKAAAKAARKMASATKVAKVLTVSKALRDSKAKLPTAAGSMARSRLHAQAFTAAEAAVGKIEVAVEAIEAKVQAAAAIEAIASSTAEAAGAEPSVKEKAEAVAAAAAQRAEAAAAATEKKVQSLAAIAAVQAKAKVQSVLTAIDFAAKIAEKAEENAAAAETQIQAAVAKIRAVAAGVGNNTIATNPM